MADHCAICDTRRPEGGTNHLVLNGGELWIEFCAPCGESEILTNPETGEEISVAALFRRTQEESGQDRESYSDDQDRESYSDEDSFVDDDWDGYTDVEADAHTLASAGMGTDEDYGYFGEEY